MIKAYLSGPMTGHKDWNFPLFNKAAEVLREEGYEVFNPAETDNGDTSKPWEYYMAKDIKAVCDSEIIFVLPGWRGSQGASLEVMVGERLGLKVIDFESRKEIEETVLETAQRLVSGDRRSSYGHPLDDYQTLSALWSAFLRNKLTEQITFEEALMMMVLLKLNREHTKSKKDNRIDAAGYIQCLDVAILENERRQKE